MRLQVSYASAILSCIGMATTFVGTLYMVPSSIQRRSHDDPVQIKARFLCVFISTIIAVLMFSSFLPEEDFHPSQIFYAIGLKFHGLLPAVTLPLLLTMLLFLGPLLGSILEPYYRRNFGLTRTGMVMKLDRPISWEGYFRYRIDSAPNRYSLIRNLFVGPLSEELVFRGCMIPLLRSAGFSRTAVVFGSPVLFGIAHAHHALQRIRQGMQVSHAFIITLVQFTYTSVFGWIASFIFLRTGNLLSCFLSHAFCNFMGLPDISFFFPPDPQYPDVVTSCLHRHRFALLVVYFLGVFLFFKGLYPLTAPEIFDSPYWSILEGET